MEKPTGIPSTITTRSRVLEEEKKKKSEKRDKSGKEIKRKERKERERKEHMLATMRDVRLALRSGRRVTLLMYKETYFLFEEFTSSLSKIMLSILQDYRDVFPEELASRLPPICGIKHQIDFMTSATILNKLVYRTNLKELKEIQR